MRAGTGNKNIILCDLRYAWTIKWIATNEGKSAILEFVQKDHKNYLVKLICGGHIYGGTQILRWKQRVIWVIYFRKCAILSQNA